MNLNIRKKQMITYAAVLLVSILYIIVGHNLAIANYHAFSGDDQSIVIKAEVVELTDRYTVMYPLNEFEYAEDETIVFRAKVTSGDMKGQTIEAAQTLDYFTAVHLPVVEPGDRILLYSIPGGMAEHEWLMSDYQRFDQILILGAVFVLLVLLIGHWQGVNTLISLALTCLAVFYVFIPAVLAGESIYLWSIATCIYVTFGIDTVYNKQCHKSDIDTSSNRP